ncbi:F0F1 ATP synthase subunit B family protein [Desulfopila aestuarii]|uniref:ATP synthase subunit b n=1 Tax=Desulfopila aestuarii DSM 18488 TaxID=1121416 RepID=A0A1M7Y2M3_9BACT|nr:ATP synthase F0 subunit B [Desulfopila aestuarii]SHO46157.1 F-type H+-transporting ATPase subunit b [Desulfopila aestuarii DSM 18488]
MKSVKQAARLLILAMVALCFTFSAASVWASSTQPTHGTEQQAAAGHDAAATASHDAAPAEGHGEAAAGSHGAAGGSLSAAKLKDLGLRVMNFAVLLFLLVKFAAKPIGSGLAGRRKAIKDEIEELEAKKATAEKSYKEFEQKLATVEKDIDKVVDRAIAQAEVEKAKIIEKAEQAAADIKRQAEMLIQKEIMEARRTLKNEVAEQAAVLAEELIVKNLTADDQVKIVEDYLDKVGAVQ